MARRGDNLITFLVGLAGLGAVAFALWPRRVNAGQPVQGALVPGSVPPAQPASPTTAQRATQALVGAGATAVVGTAIAGVKAGGSALASILGGSAATATTGGAAAGGTAAAGTGGSATAGTAVAGSTVGVVATAAAMAAAFVLMVYGSKALERYNAKVDQGYSIRSGLDFLGGHLEKELLAVGFSAGEAAYLRAVWVAGTGQWCRDRGFNVEWNWLTERIQRAGAMSPPASGVRWDMGVIVRGDGSTYSPQIAVPLAAAGQGFMGLATWLNATNPGAPYYFEGVTVQRFVDGSVLNEVWGYDRDGNRMSGRLSEDGVAADFARAGFPEWRVRNAFRWALAATGAPAAPLATFVPPKPPLVWKGGRDGAQAPAWTEPVYLPDPAIGTAANPFTSALAIFRQTTRPT